MRFFVHLHGQSTPKFALSRGAEVTQDDLAGALARGLKRRWGHLRNAAKVISQELGIDHRTAGKMLCGRTVPSACGLVVMMREVEEVRDEVFRLAGAADAAEAARVKAALTQIENTLASLGGRRGNEPHR